MACNLWVAEIFMNCNLKLLKHGHVHAHRHINIKPPRHYHHVVTLFHLCRRKQQHPGSSTCVCESHLHQTVGSLVIREQRCCPWILCMTNSGDVYFTALTHTHTMSPCCTPPASTHDGKTKQAEIYWIQRDACIEAERQNERWRVELQKCILTGRLKKLKLRTQTGTQFPVLWKQHIFHLNGKEIALEVSILRSLTSPPLSAIHAVLLPWGTFSYMEASGY